MSLVCVRGHVWVCQYIRLFVEWHDSTLRHIYMVYIIIVTVLILVGVSVHLVVQCPHSVLHHLVAMIMSNLWDGGNAKCLHRHGDPLRDNIQCLEDHQQESHLDLLQYWPTTHDVSNTSSCCNSSRFRALPSRDNFDMIHTRESL